MERLIESDPVTDVVAMAMMLYSFPILEVGSFEAAAVFPGQGEHWRVIDAVKTWEEETLYVEHPCFFHPQYLLVAGDNPTERTRIPLTIDALKEHPFFLRKTEGVHCQVNAEHTREQAEFIRERTEALGIDSIILFVSPYHLLRAYCTLLKVYDGTEAPLIYPMPVPVPPSQTVPETSLSSWELAPGEVRRIIEYQKKGHVASKHELVAHLEQLWKSLP